MLTQQELDRLAGVIAEIETQTSGEIRLMIVKRSSVTGHVGTLLWLLLVSLAFLGIWYGRHDLVFYERWWLWPAIMAASFLLSVLLSRLEFLQRTLTPNHDLHHQVWTRAEVEFHREGLSDTSLHTGVLLFLSRLERQAVVLADRGIAEKVPPGTWNKVVATMIDGARTGRWEARLEAALRECGAYLAEHFPPQPDKKNELSNAVIVKD